MNCPELMEVVTYSATLVLPQWATLSQLCPQPPGKENSHPLTLGWTHTYKHTTHIPVTQATIYTLMDISTMITYPHQDT